MRHDDPNAPTGLPARLAILLGVLLLSCYVLSTHVPPPAGPAVFHAGDQGFTARLFPGVPSAWILQRLACVAAGAILLAFAPGAITAGRRRATPAREPSEEREGASEPGNVTLPLMLAAGWILHRLVVSIGSPRTADGIDGIDGYLCYETAAAAGFDFLGGTCPDGSAMIAGILHGAGLFGRGWLPLNLPLVQVVSAAWTAASAVLVARVIARRIGTPAATVATAVFLWSPAVLIRPLLPTPFVMTTLTALLLTLADVGHARWSIARAATFGAVAGFATHVPGLLLLVPLLALAPRRGGRCDARCSSSAAFVFLVVAFAGRIGPGAASSWGWPTAPPVLHATESEAIDTGRVAPLLVAGLKDAAVARRGDVVLGAALFPLASGRSSSRMRGDSTTEPIGAALATVGLFAALGVATNRRAARTLLLFGIAACLPAWLMSTDRGASADVGIVAMLLAAWGFLTLVAMAPAFLRGNAAALVVALVIAASGTRLFDVVTPPLLHPSAAGLALRAGAALDQPVGWSPGVSGLSLPYMRVLSFQLADGRVFGWNPSAVHRRLPEPESPVVLWTPGEQMDRRVSHVLCEERAGRRLYELSDASGHTRLFAAFREDIAEPRSTDEVRWTPKTCSDTLMTDAVVANRAIDEAARLVADGRPEEALTLLKNAATATVAQPRLYFPIASLLAARGETLAAEEWAALACRITQGSYYEACALAASLRGRATSG